jgi:hypothetical protein
MRGDDAGELPPIALMSEPDFALYLQEELAEQGPAPVPDHYEVALAKLGLSAPGGLSPESFIAQQVEHVDGLYRWGSKDILLIDHGAKFNAVQASNVLLHEFIHALQDRSTDLPTLEQEQGASYDSYLAVDALIEGEARFFQDRYGASMLGLDPNSIDWRLHFQSAAERDAALLSARDNRYSDTYDVFPYSFGARYVNFAWQSDQRARLLPRYENPPTQSRSLMASTAGVADDVVTRDIVALEPSAEWTEVSCGALGAWGIFLTFAVPATNDAAQALALEWRGDSFCVYANADETLLSWRLELNDETSAAALAGPAASLLGAPAVRQNGARLALAWASNGDAPEWAFGP